jgi:hypothetical protein
MSVSHPTPDDVEQLLRNAQLRDELEPYFDESVELLAKRQRPTSNCTMCCGTPSKSCTTREWCWN